MDGTCKWACATGCVICIAVWSQGGAGLHVSTQLVLFCCMATPAHVFGQKVAALAKDWSAEQLDKLHGAREFCSNVSLLMGLNAMLGLRIKKGCCSNHRTFLCEPKFQDIYSHIREQCSKFVETMHAHPIYIYIYFFPHLSGEGC